MTNLEQAKARLEQLQSESTELGTQLDQAIENADAETAITVRQKLDQNAVRQFVQKSKVIRLEQAIHQSKRDSAIAERDELETRYDALARQVELAQKRLQDVWEEWQRVGVQIFALEQTMETERQNVHEKQKTLIDRTIRWKQDAHLVPAHEAACDL